jgi:hypothetical protein
MMRSILLSLVVLPILGCPMSAVTPQNSAVSDKCPVEPIQTLQPSNVKPITLPAKLSDMASQDLQLGYTFEAQTGQKINLRNIDNLCVWIYSPDNQLLSGTDLPKTGKYTIQIASPKSSKKLDIDIGFNDVNTATTSPSTPTPQANFTFTRGDYPKPSCGDPLPSDQKAYPINFYPVEAPYSISNLNKIRANFCGDAFDKKSDDTKLIQIASFTNKEKAQAFANLVGSAINGTKVGAPTTRIWGQK